MITAQFWINSLDYRFHETLSFQTNSAVIVTPNMQNKNSDEEFNSKNDKRVNEIRMISK